MSEPFCVNVPERRSAARIQCTSYVAVEEVDQFEATAEPSGQSHASAYIDAPVKGRTFTGQYVYIEGWCFFEDELLQQISAHWLELELPVSVELGITRPDVSQIFQNEERARSGFRIHVFTYSVPDAEFTVTIFAHSVSGSTQPIGRIHLRQHEYHQRRRFRAKRAELFPIGIAAGGRSGTTLLMRFFNAHPQIVAHAEYPFERSLLNFGIQRFHELTLPAAYSRVHWPSREIVTHENRNAPQAFPERIAADSNEGDWLVNVQAQTAHYMRSCIDDYYMRMASAQCKRARAFAEKLSDFRHQYLDFLNIYQRGRLVVLVRDPRDKFVSQRSFDQKRGFDGGWYIDSDGTLGGFIRKLKQELWMKLELLRRFPSQAIAIRFEDLVMRPATILEDLFRRLSLKSKPAIVRQIIAEVEADDSRFAHHRTAPQPQLSVFRWETDLERDVAGAFSLLLAEELKAFGYEVDQQPTRPSESLLRRSVKYAK